VSITTTVDPQTPEYRQNAAAMQERLDELDGILDQVRGGGGEAKVARHRKRGKLLARERIDLLLDRDAPFLELQPFIGWGSDFHPGGSVVTGIGVVSGVECLITANDPTVRGGASNPFTLRKILRAGEIAYENRLPQIHLVESGGADLPTQLDLFIPGGQMFRDLTRASAAGLPTIAIVFGNSTAGGAYVPAMCDYTVFVRDRAKVFLGGPPLVKMATGEVSDDEELGGAEMHARTSGLADYLAEDEADGLRIGRDIVRNLGWEKQGRGPQVPPELIEPPRADPEQLLGIVPSDLRQPFDPNEVLARIVDGSRFDPFKPTYGTALTVGWARIHGYPVGILINARGVLFSDEAQKATQFIQLANQKSVPLLFLHNTTGFMVGREYEQGGIIKHGAQFLNAISNSTVPHLGVVIGASYGAANYAMSGRAYRPRFLFAWPNAVASVMGPDQLAGVLSIVARQAAEAQGRPYDEDADAAMQDAVRGKIASEQVALAVSGRGYDDGIIDPRDTRTVLGMALSACHSAPVAGAEGYGVFRT
jgi:acetyl-CoA carboxylase carboxyltransferase component